MFSEVQNFPFTAFFPMSLFFMAKKNNPCLPVGKKKRPTNSKGAVS
jgi:hypothetical protein